MNKLDEIGSKQKILEAALKEFGEQGYEGARVDRIARVAGVNKAMIYYHFSSKDNLYREVIRGHFLANIVRLGEAIDAASDLKEILLQAADTYRTLFHNQPHFLSIALRELAKPHSEMLAEIADSIRGSQVPPKIAGALQRGIDNGDIRSLDLRQTLVSFITMNIGYYLSSQLMNRVNEIEDVDEFTEQRKAAVVDLFLYGVMKR